jgi:hypothetical protein
VVEVLYPGYRAYVENRIKVNDAMTALLAGSRLAAHTLQLTAGSSMTLGQVFPAVEHIGRFNLRSDEARNFLLDADYHLASVAVPYALATHEDFVMSTLNLLTAHGRTLVTHGKQVRAWNMHAVLFETVSVPEPDEWMQTFQVLRELRNCITHVGGSVSTRLRDAIVAMDSAARAGWERINLGLPPESIDQDGHLALTAEHIFSAFAVTKRLGREINTAIASELSKAEWATIAVDDFADQTTKPRNSSSWRRALLGFTRQHYPGLGILESELELAARARGLWARHRWSD